MNHSSTVSLWDEVCTNPDQAEVSGGYKSIWNCDTGNMTRVNLTPPLKQSLEQDAESGYNNKAFGLYLDYAATVGSVEDIIVPSLGIYFGGDLRITTNYSMRCLLRLLLYNIVPLIMAR